MPILCVLVLNGDRLAHEVAIVRRLVVASVVLSRSDDMRMRYWRLCIDWSALTTSCLSSVLTAIALASAAGSELV